ncbi:patatin-like phospholipase family protein [Sulfurimonas sp.]|uniref:patatin-like phospholipase family protein n=1 Tax=Sulfurimonas sp. TaxID=2022749 RepID=UPI002622A597|nr:patatin-like phospholipase family protein [Sulfurimonas sp.]
MQKKTVSLVLGSGGARGLAHIGIIRYLEENDYEIESISGCSIGALVGGFYAAGKLDIYENWLKEVNTLEMLTLLDFNGSGGLISGKKLISKLKELVGDYNIEDLRINFTAVATDIDAEKEVWINSGSLLNAVRASISLPLFFTPYISPSGKKLVDGGVLNPVPIAPTFKDDTDLTISVNLDGEASANIQIKKRKDMDTSLRKKAQEYLNSITLPKTLTKEDGMYAVANKSFETLQGALARMKLAAYPSDIEIDIPRNLCGTFDFHKSEELIEYGYNLCKKRDDL